MPDLPVAYVTARLVGHDGRPARGTVTLTPVVAGAAPDATPPAALTTEPISVDLDVDGRIVLLEVAPAAFDVTFRLVGVGVPGYRVHVTPEHTASAPLDLGLAAPLLPSPAVKFVVNEAVYLETRQAAAAAKASETAAATSATSAGTSATAAESARSNAAAAQAAAAGSAGSAAQASTAASTSAGNAAQSATAAATSATAAAQSKTDADTAASLAGTRATNAGTSASAAQTSASDAATSATAASTSATGAQTAKTDAETARTAAQTARTGAETAQTGAQTARTGAETARAAAELARDVSLAGQFNGSSIAANTDVSTLTAPGVYRQGTGANATLALNYPVAGTGGVLFVVSPNASTAYVIQIYFPLGAGTANGRTFYMRGRDNGSWQPWRTQSSDQFAQAASGTGVFDYFKWNPAANGDMQIMPTGVQLGTNDLNNIKSNGRYIQPGPVNATLASNYPVAGAAGVLDVTVLSSTAMVQRYMIHGGVNGEVRGEYLRRWAGTAWEAWRYVPGQRTDISVGRRIFTWDEFNAREQMIFGDTGWRDVSGLLINGWTANANQVLLRRYGATVMLKLIGIDRTNSTSDAFLNSITGFRNPNGQGWWPYARSDGSISYMREQGGILNLVARTVGAGAQTYATFQWLTDDAWPTALPGNAYGTIPVN